LPAPFFGLPAPGAGTRSSRFALLFRMAKGDVPMKGIIAWFLGVPIFVIILLYLFNIF
jgi:hypothetical protein